MPWLKRYRFVWRPFLFPLGLVAFMALIHGMALFHRSALAVLEARLRKEKGIGLDDLTLMESSLLESREEGYIRGKDWERKEVAVRPVADCSATGGTRKVRICG